MIAHVELKREYRTQRTRIPARWVQAIIPSLNSFLFLSARKSEFLLFLNQSL